VARYIDVQQLYTDAKVAGILCKGGPIAYRLVEENISNEWLFQHVCPNIRARFPNDTRFCRNMALAILWACMDGEYNENVALVMQQRVETAYNELYSSLHPDAEEPGDDGRPNPVYKAPLHIYPVEGTLQINVQLPDVIAGAQQPQGEVAQAAGNVVNNPLLGVDRQSYNTLVLQLHQLKQAQSALQQHIDTQFANITNKLDAGFNRVNTNVRAYGGDIRGAFAVGVNGAARRQRQQVQDPAPAPEAAVPTVPIEGVDPRAKLVPRPRTLMELWTEYTQGINGNKPAREFTARERNNRRDGIKQKYFRRKVVWQMIDRKVREGMTATAACHAIRSAYGFQLSVTQIINMMMHDRTHRPHGCHPNLR
jgi:hypothetical protein